jgi:ABC-type protease/lipase transport system fused ATPase/permease subunit
MYLITKNSSIKGIFISSISRRLSRGLSSEINPAEKDQQENEEKKAKQQKYQELEKLQFRPLYLDAQATTPMVNFIYLNSFFNIFYRIHVYLIKCYHI